MGSSAHLLHINCKTTPEFIKSGMKMEQIWRKKASENIWKDLEGWHCTTLEPRSDCQTKIQLFFFWPIQIGTGRLYCSLNSQKRIQTTFGRQFKNAIRTDLCQC